ncbi:MAG: TonB family protein [Pseudomonadota bacterium]
MRQTIEKVVFLALALAIHVAVWLQWPAEGVESGGSGGDVFVSVAAADGAMQAVIEEWEAAQEAANDPDPQLEQTVAEPEPPVEEAVQPTTEAEPPIEPEPVITDQQTDVETPIEEIATKLPSQPEVRPRLESVPAPVPPPPPSERPRPTPPERAQPSPQPSAPAVREQRAAGTGGGTIAGTAQPQEVASIDPGQQRSLMASWGGQIQAQIARRARSARAQSGRVIVQIVLNRNGQVQQTRVLQSSGSPDTDNAALEAVARAGRFPAAPNELPGETHRFQLPISIGG